jgi:hypothetical protein
MRSTMTQPPPPLQVNSVSGQIDFSLIPGSLSSPAGPAVFWGATTVIHRGSPAGRAGFGAGTREVR